MRVDSSLNSLQNMPAGNMNGQAKAGGPDAQKTQQQQIDQAQQQ
jgi:hypothetical protein